MNFSPPKNVDSSSERRHAPRMSDIRPRRNPTIRRTIDFPRVSPSLDKTVPIAVHSVKTIASLKQPLSLDPFRASLDRIRTDSKKVVCPEDDRPYQFRMKARRFQMTLFIGSILRILGTRRVLVSAGIAFFLVGFAWWGVRIFEWGMETKEEVLGASTDGYGAFSRALDEVKDRNFEASAQSFRDASGFFSDASGFFAGVDETVLTVSRFLPIVSKLSSGKDLVDAARDIADAGVLFSAIGSQLSLLENPMTVSGESSTSYLDVFRDIRSDATKAERLLSKAVSLLDRVSVNDIPEEKREEFLQLKTRLPEALLGLQVFLEHGDIFSDMLGGNGFRKFLFLFQNNQEMRATGGFIGSYAFLEMNDGRVRTFFIDGIFNPDGQIHEDIVPPLPIQKVSAAWSLHDSNWFPDFPMSAEKAIHFYEKTGGPTVDGVVTLTPEILKRLLSISGPIFLEKYKVTVDEGNFLESIQYEVEVAYDKKTNRPKQILADLAPKILDRVFGKQAPSGALGKAIKIIETGLSEKHVLFYSRNENIERLIRQTGWSGEVLSARRDYASVIHSNINGYKTDGVIDESITHRADIWENGSVVDTITIKRTHRGGTTGYEWWDRVNADYMRVYVPLGSTLLSAEGHTRETVTAPIDYDALGFSRDPDIDREERGMRIDPASGTRISEDAGKTVFGNWVYVSPGETVEVSYSYLLPFRVDPASSGTGRDSYTLVFQKQSGSRGSALSSEIRFPNLLRLVWQSDKNLIPFDGGFRRETDLVYDRYIGMLFSR